MNIAQAGLVRGEQVWPSGSMIGLDQIPPGIAIATIDGPPYPGGAIAESAVMRVGELWLYRETVQQIRAVSGSGSPLERGRAAVVDGLRRVV